MTPALLAAAFLTSAAAPPNVLLVVVDDLGARDLAMDRAVDRADDPDGATFHESPRIDALAAAGTCGSRKAYAASARCAARRGRRCFTGRHPVRVGITDWIPGQSRTGRFLQIRDRDELPLEELTLAEALREHGYRTFFAGKWHLGGPGYWPTEQGFDVNVGGHDKGSPPGGYYAPWKNPALDAKADGEFLTDRLAAETADFIESAAAEGDGRPFFAALCFYSVHTPITADRATVDHFEERAGRLFSGETPTRAERGGGNDAVTRLRRDRADYASMVAAVDRGVGTVLDALDAAGVRENTVIVLTSDNGGLSTLPRRPGPTSNAPLRAGKGWLYEGGIRVPLIVAGPGVRAGATCDAPARSEDVFPTLLDLCGLPARPGSHADGVSLAPALAGAGDGEPRDLFWHYPHYHGSGWTPGAAVRRGNWKLIEFYETGAVELYDLAADPGETRRTAPPRTRRNGTNCGRPCGTGRPATNAAMPAERAF